MIMANSASISSLGIEVLATERLFYGTKLNGAVSVFLLFSSQFLGYGIAGLMRKTLVYPKKYALASQFACRLHVGNVAPTPRTDEEAFESLFDCLRVHFLLGNHVSVDHAVIDRYVERFISLSMKHFLP